MAYLQGRSNAPTVMPGEPAWYERQVAALRAGRWTELDIDGLADELEALSRQERRMLENALTVALLHLLKLRHQPERASRSWTNSVAEHVRRIARDLDAAPSLVPYWAIALSDAYESARGRASSETGLDITTFPEEVDERLYQSLRASIAEAALQLRGRRHRPPILPPEERPVLER